jgi:hypothetical protein
VRFLVTIGCHPTGNSFYRGQWPDVAIVSNTGGDAVIYVPDAKVLMTGDLLVAHALRHRLLYRHLIPLRAMPNCLDYNSPPTDAVQNNVKCSADQEFGPSGNAA